MKPHSRLRTQRQENPDLNKVGIRTFGCPTQFKDVGLERDSFDDEGKLRNPKRDEVTINGFFAGKEGMATRIYQKSLHRLIKIPIQNAEFHEAEFTQPCPKQSDLETAMNLEVPPSVLPSLTKLRNITEGEEKWDCSAQTTETQPYLSALPDGIPNNAKAKSVLNRAALKAMTNPTVNQTRSIDPIRKSD